MELSNVEAKVCMQETVSMKQSFVVQFSLEVFSEKAKEFNSQQYHGLQTLKLMIVMIQLMICIESKSFYYFAPYYLQYGSKIIHSNETIFQPMSSICIHAKNDVRPRLFHQIIKFLSYNATGTLRFFQNVQKLVVFRKKMVFFKKNHEIFKIAKGGKYAVKCVSIDIIF